MNLLIDPTTGFPRWEASAQTKGPKEEFALGSALRLKSGELSLEKLKNQIIDAANLVWCKQGKSERLNTLNDVKANLGKSAKDWYFEIQRVFERPELLQLLIDNEGRGLTAISRRAGPIQAQRKKGFSHQRPILAIEELIMFLREVQLHIEDGEVCEAQLTLECKKDLAKYKILLNNSGAGSI
ncbi:hypothetical protein [Sphingomonas aerolata]|uniref:hypothetical protein n=1 Tax=Sphingomonas aerolata TaxID=185951 RepID=UPI00141A6FFB|nr:hypothetical protein [Sphingomonas aerolata]NII58326.1 hypothetical protein [Sphingomonas aerolata]